MKIKEYNLAFAKTKNNVTDSAHIASYTDELKVLGYRPGTVSTKVYSIRTFKKITQKSYAETSIEDIKHFISYLKEKGLHTHTVEGYYRYTEQFYLYLERKKIIRNNPFNYYTLKLKKQPPKTRDILTQKEVVALYKSVKTLREKILLHLCYGCGLRALELERINLEDIKTGQSLVIVDKGKNDRRRTIPITESMRNDFIKYLRYRKSQSSRSQALLLNEQGSRLRTYSARSMLSKMLKRSQVNTDQTKEITLHSLRHSIATHLLENGMPVAQVQQLLGHKQLETTEIYTRVCQKQLRAISEKNKW